MGMIYDVVNSRSSVLWVYYRGQCENGFFSCELYFLLFYNRYETGNISFVPDPSICTIWTHFLSFNPKSSRYSNLLLFGRLKRKSGYKATLSFSFLVNFLHFSRLNIQEIKFKKTNFDCVPNFAGIQVIVLNRLSLYPLVSISNISNLKDNSNLIEKLR